MMRMRTWLSGLGAGSLVLAGVISAAPQAGFARQDATPAAQEEADDDVANATPVVGTPLLQPTIDLVRAQEIALEGQNGAAVTSVKLDGDEGALMYDVELDNGLEVEIDATSGEILKTEQNNGAEDDEDMTGEHEAGANGDDGDENEAGGNGDAGEADGDDDSQEDQDESGDVDNQDDEEGAGDDA